MKTTLDKVKEGQKCLICKVDIPNKVIKQRFLDMGLTKGVVVSVYKMQKEKKGLIILGIYNTKYMVRKIDVQYIDVKILENEKINTENETTKQ